MKVQKVMYSALIAVAGCAMVGCGAVNTNNTGNASPGAGQANTTSAGAGKTDANKDITIGYMNWDEDVAATYLWERLLEQRGYQVHLQSLSPGPVWIGLHEGQIDVFLDTWMPYVDKTYMAKYGSNLVNLGQWYAGQTQEGFVVPDYMSNIRTMADLQAHASEFQNQIVGIEPGAIEMGQAKQALSTYHVQMNLIASSTPAMLTELQKAYKEKQPIVVTLWSPHWAFAKYKLHYIQDPKQVFGKPGIIETVANASWTDDHPVATGWLKHFHLSVQQLGTLEEDIAQHPNDKMTGVNEWIQQNQSVVNSWFTN